MTSESLFWLRSFGDNEKELLSSCEFSRWESLLWARSIEEKEPTLLDIWNQIKDDKNISKKDKADIIKERFPGFSAKSVISIIQWKGYKYWSNSQLVLEKIKNKAREKRAKVSSTNA